MSHEDRLIAFTAAPPPTVSVASIAASSPTIESEPDGMRAAGRYHAQEMTAAKSAVAEYLRNLGLRDPDAIAAESQCIVNEALRQSDSASLTETALRVTVKRLEHFLALLAAQTGGADGTARFGSVVAGRLPALMGEFPQVLSAKNLPADVIGALRKGIAPVVPPAQRKRMRRQRLALVPRWLQCIVDFARGSGDGL